MRKVKPQIRASSRYRAGSVSGAPAMRCCIVPRPSPASSRSSPNQRTSATSTFGRSSAAAGSQKTKAEITKALAESFDYCDATFVKLDDQKILSSGPMVIAFLHTTVHNNEIYGNVVGYLRANHILPPSTEMMQEIRKGNKTAAEVMKEMMEKYTKK